MTSEHSSTKRHGRISGHGKAHGAWYRVGHSDRGEGGAMRGMVLAIGLGFALIAAACSNDDPAKHADGGSDDALAEGVAVDEPDGSVREGAGGPTVNTHKIFITPREDEGNRYRLGVDGFSPHAAIQFRIYRDGQQVGDGIPSIIGANGQTTVIIRVSPVDLQLGDEVRAYERRRIAPGLVSAGSYVDTSLRLVARTIFNGPVVGPRINVVPYDNGTYRLVGENLPTDWGAKFFVYRGDTLIRTYPSEESQDLAIVTNGTTTNQNTLRGLSTDDLQFFDRIVLYQVDVAGGHVQHRRLDMIFHGLPQDRGGFESYAPPTIAVVPYDANSDGTADSYRLSASGLSQLSNARFFIRDDTGDYVRRSDGSPYMYERTLTPADGTSVPNASTVRGISPTILQAGYTIQLLERHRSETGGYVPPGGNWELASEIVFDGLNDGTILGPRVNIRVADEYRYRLEGVGFRGNSLVRVHVYRGSELMHTVDQVADQNSGVTPNATAKWLTSFQLQAGDRIDVIERENPNGGYKDENGNSTPEVLRQRFTFNGPALPLRPQIVWAWAESPPFVTARGIGPPGHELVVEADGRTSSIVVDKTSSWQVEDLAIAPGSVVELREAEAAGAPIDTWQVGDRIPLVVAHAFATTDNTIDNPVSLRLPFPYEAAEADVRGICLVNTYATNGVNDTVLSRAFEWESADNDMGWKCSYEIDSANRTMNFDLSTSDGTPGNGRGVGATFLVLDSADINYDKGNYDLGPRESQLIDFNGSSQVDGSGRGVVMFNEVLEYDPNGADQFIFAASNEGSNRVTVKTETGDRDLLGNNYCSNNPFSSKPFCLDDDNACDAESCEGRLVGKVVALQGRQGPRLGNSAWAVGGNTGGFVMSNAADLTADGAIVVTSIDSYWARDKNSIDRDFDIRTSVVVDQDDCEDGRCNYYTYVNGLKGNSESVAAGTVIAFVFDQSSTWNEGAPIVVAGRNDGTAGIRPSDNCAGPMTEVVGHGISRLSLALDRSSLLGSGLLWTDCTHSITFTTADHIESDAPKHIDATANALVPSIQAFGGDGAAARNLALLNPLVRVDPALPAGALPASMLDNALPASALPASALPASALPASALPASALPASALPASALPASALPASALPASALPASALVLGALPASALPASFR